MRRDEDFIAVCLCRLEDPSHVLDGMILGHAGPDRAPIGAVLAQHVVLRIDEDDGGIAAADVHGCSPFWFGQGRRREDAMD